MQMTERREELQLFLRKSEFSPPLKQNSSPLFNGNSHIEKRKASALHSEVPHSYLPQTFLRSYQRRFQILPWLLSESNLDPGKSCVCVTHPEPLQTPERTVDEGASLHPTPLNILPSDRESLSGNKRVKTPTFKGTEGQSTSLLDQNCPQQVSATCLFLDLWH